MWLNAKKIKEISALRGLSLRTLLRQAGVSRTAYYNLVQAPTLVPSSIQKLARTLNLPMRELLSSGSIEEELYRGRLDQLNRIMRQYPKANRENIWHTLVLLEQKPIERLRGALRRAIK